MVTAQVTVGEVENEFVEVQVIAEVKVELWDKVRIVS